MLILMRARRQESVLSEKVNEEELGKLTWGQSVRFARIAGGDVRQNADPINGNNVNGVCAERADLYLGSQLG